jgi:hypothetical protein
VGARLMVIAEIRGEGALQMAGIQDNEMVQTVSADRSDERLCCNNSVNESDRLQYIP